MCAAGASCPATPHRGFSEMAIANEWGSRTVCASAGRPHGARFDVGTIDVTMKLPLTLLLVKVIIFIFVFAAHPS